MALDHFQNEASLELMQSIRESDPAFDHLFN